MLVQNIQNKFTFSSLHNIFAQGSLDFLNLS